MIKGYLILLFYFISFEVLSQNNYTCYIWLKTDCPVCIKVIPSIKYLIEEDDIEVKLLFVNATKKEVKQFLNEYSLKSEGLIDKKFRHAQLYGITTAPEVILLFNKKIVYKGAIDNSVPALGVFNIPTVNYILSVMKRHSSNNSLEYIETKAVGCVFR